MRPLELRLRNFRSYFESEAVFDFRGRRLVGIVGPIGSGKSSILDAIAFALYGRTPTVARGTKALIHQRAGAAHIALRFEVDGDVWEAVRVLRAKGQSAHALYRLDGDTAEPKQLEKITLEADVNDRIRVLLGMEFDAFSRSVMLAQGRFAEFLRAPPRDRDKVLKGVFGHDRIDAMRTVAKERVQQAEIELAALGERATRVEAAMARAAEVRQSIASLEERVELLRKAEPALRDLDERAAALARTITESEARIGELDELGAKLPGSADSEAILVAAERVSARVDEADASVATAEGNLAAATEIADALQNLRHEVEAATQILADLEPRRRAAAVAAKRLEEAAAVRAGAQAAVATAEVEVQTRQEAASVAKATATDTATAAESAEADYHAAQHADFARTLRHGLAPGETCPVCEQAVDVVPTTASGEDVVVAKETLDRARAAHKAAAEAQAAAAADLQGARASLEAAREAMTDAVAKEEAAGGDLQVITDEVDRLEDRARELLGDGSPEEELRARVEQLTTADKAVTAARAALDAAIAERRRLYDETVAAEKAHTSLRLELAGVGTHVGVDVNGAEDTPAATRQLLESVRTAWSRASAAARAAVDEAGKERVATLEERAVLVGPLDIEDSFAADLSRAEAALEQSFAELDRLGAEIAAAAGIVDRRTEVAAQKARFDRLAGDLTDSKFVRFLLEEQRHVLAELGSAHFSTLSAGRYRFTEAFEVVDLTAADAVRKPESLSGGETFLASLALAIALAEMVARTGGRLDAFFLDEGFGSLDTEHLDLAMDGIEALVAGGSDRFVAVVSHVPEMMHRLEDLIVLDRDPTTGDTRVVRA